MSTPYIPVQTVDLRSDRASHPRPGCVYLGITDGGSIEPLPMMQGIVGVMARLLSSLRQTIMVDMREHRLRGGFDLPSRDAAIDFHVDVAFSVRPSAPDMVALECCDKDMSTPIVESVRDEARQLSRSHTASDDAGFESRLRDRLISHRLRGGTFRVFDVHPTVVIDKRIRKAREEEMQIDYEGRIQMRKMDYRMKLAEVLRALLPAVPSRELVAMRLAQEPDKIGEVIQMIENRVSEHEQFKLTAIQTVYEMVKSGSIESADVGDVISQAMSASALGYHGGKSGGEISGPKGSGSA